MRRLTRLGRSSPARSRLKALRATGRLVAVSVARYTEDCSECATSLRISKRPILLADMPVLVPQAGCFRVRERRPGVPSMMMIAGVQRGSELRRSLGRTEKGAELGSVG